VSAPIWVELGDRRYPVIGLPGDAGSVAASIDEVARPGSLIVLTDENVHAAHGDALSRALDARGRTARWHVIPPGEGSKSVTTISRLWEEVFSEPVQRTDTVVAVGGGVVGDLGGFLASTLLRGIDVVQVATTVLAMSDAAVGGKTGINVPAGKNLVGTFHQPRAVLQWTGALATLPERERHSGVAEVVKSALLAGEEEVAWLETNGVALASGEPAAVTHAVQMSAGLKAKIVADDEREGGARRLLNLGHTLGHVIEHATGYGSWTHGEAVATGMVLALDLGQARGFGTPELRERVVSILAAQKLPVAPPSLTVGQWTGPLAVDKKRTGDSIQFVFCSAPGNCQVVPVPIVDVVDWLSRMC
jgi:3-dehydroquinate synthase